MAKQVQFRGGTTTQHESFIGKEREVTVDTTKNTLVVHDNSTAGGHPLAKSSELNTTNDNLNISTNALAPYSGYMAWQKDNFYFNTSSSFLASIADKNRYLKFGDKVVDTYGDELVTNGDFSDGTTGWTLDSNWRIENNRAITTGSSGNIKQNINVQANTIFKYSFYIGNINTSTYIDVKYNNITVKAIRSTDNNGIFDIYLIGAGIAEIRFYSYLDNKDTFIEFVSCKQIQTKSAIDYIPEVHVQDQATYGLTTQQSVNAGDYVVVDREELVTTQSYSGSIGAFAIILETIPDTVGSGFMATLKVNSSDGDGVKLLVRDYATNTQRYSTGYITSGELKLIIPNTYTKYKIQAYSGGSVTTVDISDFSVKQLDEVYRAKVNAPSDTLLTNTTYFEVRDNLPISNQIAFLHTMDATTKAYEGITNEILFNDALAIETPKAIMLKNGFSEVSKGLYSKGSKWYIFSAYWQTLNKGAYHPIWNMTGCSFFKAETTDYNSYWYETAKIPSLNTMSDCFSEGQPALTRIFGRYLSNGVISGSILDGLSGKARPDSKYYDIIYTNQFISFESSELAYKPTELEMKEIREYEKFRGVEGLVFTEEKLQTTIGSVATLEVNNGTKYTVNQYIQVFGDSTPYRKRILSISGNTLTLDSVFSTSKTASNYIIGGGSIPFNSKGSHLKTGRLGNPTNYEQITKDRLSENKNLFGQITLFIDDNGNSLIPDGVIDTFKVSTKSNTFYNIIRSTDNGATWTNVTPTSSYITNSLTLTNEPTGNIVLIPYTSQNNPYQATTPKAVLTVEPKVIASNSHSIYKGAITGNCIGKVQVGNGTNGYESKVLENSEVSYDYLVLKSVPITIPTGASVVFSSKNGLFDNATEDYIVYQRLGSALTNFSFETSTNIENDTVGWKVLGYTSGSPSHSTISLDNANSPASKWFEGLCYNDDYVYPYAIIEELAYNTGTSSYDGDDDKFTQLTNGTLIDLNGNTIKTGFYIGQGIRK